MKCTLRHYVCESQGKGTARREGGGAGGGKEDGQGVKLRRWPPALPASSSVKRGGNGACFPGRRGPEPAQARPRLRDARRGAQPVPAQPSVRPGRPPRRPRLPHPLPHPSPSLPPRRAPYLGCSQAGSAMGPEGPRPPALQRRPGKQHRAGAREGPPGAACGRAGPLHHQHLQKRKKRPEVVQGVRAANQVPQVAAAAASAAPQMTRLLLSQGAAWRPSTPQVLAAPFRASSSQGSVAASWQ